MIKLQTTDHLVQFKQPVKKCPKMEARLQDLKIPRNCKVIKNHFSTYDPDTEFTEEKNLYYLQEDLLQIYFPDLDMTVDLGWYGDTSNNKGEFKILVIKNSDWENPIKMKSSSSQKTINRYLEKILAEINGYKEI